MIRRLFVYLSVLILFCFITSCKKDSPIKEVTSKNESVNTTISKSNKENLVIRDDKVKDDEFVSVNDLNSSSEVSELDKMTSEIPSEVSTEIEKPVYDVAESLPEFPGGIDALNKYIIERTSKLTELGSLKKTLRTMISLIVETDGSLSSLNVAKSSGNKVFDEKAIQIVLHMPAWAPATNHGENVRMKYVVPVMFNPTHNSYDE